MYMRLFNILEILIIFQPLGFLFDTLGVWDIAFYYSGGGMIVGAGIMGAYTLHTVKRGRKIQGIKEKVIGD